MWDELHVVLDYVLWIGLPFLEDVRLFYNIYLLMVLLNIFFKTMSEFNVLTRVVSRKR